MAETLERHLFRQPRGSTDDGPGRMCATCCREDSLKSEKAGSRRRVGRTIRGIGLVERTNLNRVVFCGAPPGWIAGLACGQADGFCGVIPDAGLPRLECRGSRCISGVVWRNSLYLSAAHLHRRQSAPVIIALHVFPTRVTRPSTVSPPNRSPVSQDC